jgi:GNAT superfamily N-acetyltransferase
MPSRLATPADADAMATTLALAFADDPIWGPALARPDGQLTDVIPFWRLYVDGALRTSTAWLVDDAAAVAVWTPPGGSELSDAQEADADHWVQQHLSPELRVAFHELAERFEANHPHEPHAYLGLLATHPQHRGHGIAQQLLRENLAAWDAQGVPTYLESSNSANDHRYERAGYAKIGSFASVLDDAVSVAMMWRPASRDRH